MYHLKCGVTVDFEYNADEEFLIVTIRDGNVASTYMHHNVEPRRIFHFMLNDAIRYKLADV